MMLINPGEEDRSKTIIINAWDSKCANCGKSAAISDVYHKTIYGYDKNENGKPGCGTKWEYIDSDYWQLWEMLEKQHPEYKVVKRGL